MIWRVKQPQLPQVIAKKKVRTSDGKRWRHWRVREWRCGKGDGIGKEKGGSGVGKGRTGEGGGNQDEGPRGQGDNSDNPKVGDRELGLSRGQQHMRRSEEPPKPVISRSEMGVRDLTSVTSHIGKTYSRWHCGRIRKNGVMWRRENNRICSGLVKFMAIVC
jgi:hypothetical protein